MMIPSNSIRTTGATARRIRSLIVGIAAIPSIALVPPVSYASSSALEGGAAHAAERFDCLITPNAFVALGVEVQGVVQSIAVDRGEHVVAGQTLATMKSSVETANVALARDKAAMDSEINARVADLEFARQVLERQISLSAQELAPQQSIDEARARYLVAEAALRRARDNAVVDRHELLRHEALLAQRSVVSPIDGVVVRRHAEPGELVVDTPVLTVAELDTLRVEVVLPAARFGDFALGATATVHPEIAPDLAVAAVVSNIDPMLDAASGTFGVRLTLDNADGSVVAGQECLVAFDADGQAD